MEEEPGIANPVKGGCRVTYKDTVMGLNENSQRGETSMAENGEISDDDIIKESFDDSWFGMGMTRKEKLQSRRS